MDAEEFNHVVRQSEDLTAGETTIVVSKIIGCGVVPETADLAVSAYGDDGRVYTFVPPSGMTISDLRGARLTVRAHDAHARIGQAERSEEKEKTYAAGA